MFFILSKILGFLVSPLVWALGLLVYSFFTKVEGRGRKLRIASFVVLYVFSNSFLIDECYRVWEPVTPDYDLMDTRYDGAIILGGIGDIDLRLKKINFSYGADRLLQPLSLYHQGRVKRLIFTGGSGSLEFPEKREGLYVQKYLRSIHIPDSALLIESTSKNTYENARNTKQLLDSLHLEGNFLLVTSGFHMPRAMAVFKKVGFKNLTPYVTNRASGVRRYTFDHLFIPNSGAMHSFEFLVHEWLGFLVYKLKGYA